MSHSHSAVGHALAQRKQSKGSRMESRPAPLDHIAAALDRKEQFTVLARGFSYDTVVAQHLVNNHTQEHELWISPQYYSQSTLRHTGSFRAGFLSKYSSDNVFVTPAVHRQGVFRNRSQHLFAGDALSIVDAALPDVDKPRLRDATRRGTIVSCINRLDLARRNMTKGIPLDSVDAATLYELQNMTHFLEMLHETTDIDEVRAAVRAHTALNNTRNS